MAFPPLMCSLQRLAVQGTPLRRDSPSNSRGCQLKDDPRKIFARSIVEALAANNWDRSAIEPYLCDDRRKESVDCGISFDQYKDYDDIKAVGKANLVRVTSPPAMAMDTFIPVLFNKQFAPFAGMPDQIAYHAAYIQFQTQRTAEGKECLDGWGRNDIPVKLLQQVHDAPRLRRK